MSPHRTTGPVEPSAWDRVVALLGEPDEKAARSWWWDGGDIAAARIQKHSGGEWWNVRVSACCGGESATTVQGNYAVTEDRARELVAELLLLAHETARRAAELEAAAL